MCEIETAAPETPVLPPELFLLKLGEVVLKGLNRSHFEDKLMANVARRLRPLGTFRIYTRQSTIYVEPQSCVTDMDAVYRACSQIFGIVSVVRAVPCEKSVPAIVETARVYLAPEFAKAKDFKVESKRADKRFPLNSIQLSQQVGSLLHRAFPKTAVNVHDPELTVYVEIRERAAYVHGPALPGAGGLPVGMGGKAVSLLSGGIDSPVASWMMARASAWAFSTTLERSSSSRFRYSRALPADCSISSFSRRASARSFSISWRCWSSLVSTSSKRTFSASSRAAARSMISSGRPRRREIAKALDLPGMPITSR